MIKLDVQEYCQRCPFFEAVMTTWPNEVLSSDGRQNPLRPEETVIMCKDAMRCNWVVKEALRIKEKIDEV